MPYNRTEPAKINRKVGNIKLRIGEFLPSENKENDNARNRALHYIEKKRKKTEFQAQITAHVERSGVSASHAPYIFFLRMRDNYRPIYIADKITYYRAYPEI